jgi:16S rRNA (cytidine1402-2'-O)-methyltransferase
MADLLASCRDDTRLCIAADLTLPTATIRTRTVREWKKAPIEIGKRPCVFLLLAK